MEPIFLYQQWLRQRLHESEPVNGVNGVVSCIGVNGVVNGVVSCIVNKMPLFTIQDLKPVPLLSSI